MSFFPQRGHTLEVTSRTGGSSPCTPCSRLHEGTRSNQPFHLSVSLWFAPPASSLLTLSRFPQQSPLFFSPPICQCGDVIKDIIRKICNCVGPPTSPTNTVSTLSRLGAFFFLFFLSCSCSLGLSHSGYDSRSPLKQRRRVFRQHSVCGTWGGKKKREAAQKESEGGGLIVVFVRRRQHFTRSIFLGRQGATSLFYLSAPAHSEPSTCTQDRYCV